MTIRLAFVLQIDDENFARLAQSNGWEAIGEVTEVDPSSSDAKTLSRRPWTIPSRATFPSRGRPGPSTATLGVGISFYSQRRHSTLN
jgi:hypothetical protein